jgi:hypothetical protein
MPRTERCGGLERASDAPGRKGLVAGRALSVIQLFVGCGQHGLAVRIISGRAGCARGPDVEDEARRPRGGAALRTTVRTGAAFEMPGRTDERAASMAGRTSSGLATNERPTAAARGTPLDASRTGEEASASLRTSVRTEAESGILSLERVYIVLSGDPHGQISSILHITALGLEGAFVQSVIRAGSRLPSRGLGSGGVPDLKPQAHRMR